MTKKKEILENAKSKSERRRLIIQMGLEKEIILCPHCGGEMGYQYPIGPNGETYDEGIHKCPFCGHAEVA